MQKYQQRNYFILEKHIIHKQNKTKISEQIKDQNYQGISYQDSNQSQLKDFRKKRRKKLRNKKYKNAGFWTKQENQYFLKFITKYYDDFQNNSIRRSLKVFHRMAEQMKCRTAQQCRTHHQKLRYKFGETKFILQGLKLQLKKKKLKNDSNNQVKIEEISVNNEDNDQLFTNKISTDEIKYQIKEEPKWSLIASNLQYYNTPQSKMKTKQLLSINLLSQNLGYEKQNNKSLNNNNQNKIFQNQHQIQNNQAVQITQGKKKKLIFFDLSQNKIQSPSLIIEDFKPKFNVSSNVSLLN